MEQEQIRETFSVYLAFPSILALGISLFILFSRKWRKLLLDNYIIACFLFSLLGMNFIEVITYSNLSNNFELLLRIYYSFVVLLLTSFICLSERLNNHSQKSTKYFLSFSIISSIVLIAMILETDQIIAGAISTKFTILRVPGEYYFIFLSYLITYIFIGLFLILFSIRNANNPLKKRRHKVIFFSLLPLALILSLVFILIQIDSIINLSFFLPICTLIFLIIYLFTENKRDLFRVLVNIPYSQERVAYKELNDRVIEYLSKTQTEEKISLKEAMATIEKAFISRALEIKDGDHNLAAEMLSISMSTIYRKEDKPN